MNLPEKILVRPLMRLWLFAKKHPWQSLIIALLVFLLPPLGLMIYALGAKLAGFVGRTLGERIGTAFQNFVESVLAKLADSAWVIAVPIVAGLFFPPLGLLFAVWLLTDLIKGERTTKTSTTTITTEPEPDTPSSSRAFDLPDYGFDV